MRLQRVGHEWMTERQPCCVFWCRSPPYWANLLKQDVVLYIKHNPTDACSEGNWLLASDALVMSLSLLSLHKHVYATSIHRAIAKRCCDNWWEQRSSAQLSTSGQCSLMKKVSHSKRCSPWEHTSKRCIVSSFIFTASCGLIVVLSLISIYDYVFLIT